VDTNSPTTPKSEDQPTNRASQTPPSPSHTGINNHNRDRRDPNTQKWVKKTPKRSPPTKKPASRKRRREKHPRRRKSPATRRVRMSTRTTWISIRCWRSTPVRYPSPLSGPAMQGRWIKRDREKVLNGE